MSLVTLGGPNLDTLFAVGAATVLDVNTGSPDRNQSRNGFLVMIPDTGVTGYTNPRLII